MRSRDFEAIVVCVCASIILIGVAGLAVFQIVWSFIVD